MSVGKGGEGKSVWGVGEGGRLANNAHCEHLEMCIASPMERAHSKFLCEYFTLAESSVTPSLSNERKKMRRLRNKDRKKLYCVPQTQVGMQNLARDSPYLEFLFFFYFYSRILNATKRKNAENFLKFSLSLSTPPPP